MKHIVSTLSAVACMFAGSLVLLDSGDASAAFKRLGLAYCGAGSTTINNPDPIHDLAFQCTIPSDDLLGHADVVSLQVYVLNDSGAESTARACVKNPSGYHYNCNSFEGSRAAVVTLTPDHTIWEDYPTWFPYVDMRLGPDSNLNGIKITD